MGSSPDTPNDVVNAPYAFIIKDSNSSDIVSYAIEKEKKLTPKKKSESLKGMEKIGLIKMKNREKVQADHFELIQKLIDSQSSQVDILDNNPE